MSTTVIVSDESMATTLERQKVLGVELDDRNRPKRSRIVDAGEKWTASKRKDLERMMRETKAEIPVTVLNLSRFPLKINGGVYHPDEIPACPVGQPYSRYVFTKARWGHKDNGSDMQGMMQYEAVPATPKSLAAEYVGEYGDFGVICYIGDADPATLKKDTIVSVPEPASNDLGETYVDERQMKWGDVKAAAEQKRNTKILKRLQDANAHYENEAQRNLVNDPEREAARHAQELGLIKELPRWVLISNLEPEIPDAACPSCKVVPNKGAIICANCSYVIDVVETYRLRPSACAYGSAEMDRLTPEQWQIVNKIKADRDRAKAKAQGSN